MGGQPKMPARPPSLPVASTVIRRLLIAAWNSCCSLASHKAREIRREEIEVQALSEADQPGV